MRSRHTLEMKTGAGAAFKSAVQLRSRKSRDNSVETMGEEDLLYENNDGFSTGVAVRPINWCTMLRCLVAYLLGIVPFWGVLFILPPLYFLRVYRGEGGIAYVEVIMPWTCYGAMCLWIAVLVSMRDSKLAHCLALYKSSHLPPVVQLFNLLRQESQCVCF